MDGRLEATHLPFLLDADRGPKGTLMAHVARANPIWRALESEDVLAIFAGEHAYISPAWYVNAENVPTWNYVAVHATGRAHVLAEGAPTLAVLERLVAANESGKPGPAWSLEALSRDFLTTLAREIVAFEVPIRELVAKKKLSQNRRPEDRAGAIAGLVARGDSASLAVAKLMEP
jgi:transcriptional regulator